LERLKKEERNKVAEQLKEAISFGDLSENAAYDEAKENQAFLEGKIAELEKFINAAHIIKKKKIIRAGCKLALRSFCLTV